MRTRSGEESIELGGDAAPWEDGLHSERGRGGDVSGDTTDAKKQARGSTSSQHYDRDDPLEQAPWFEPIEAVSDCPGGVCPVPWASNDNPVVTIQGRPTIQEDLVNHPSHYTDGGIECIEAIEAQQTLEEFRGYLKGNIAKYLWRERHKGGTESLKKARWYLDRLIELDEIQNG